MEIICTKFDSAVRFSKGSAALALRGHRAHGNGLLGAFQRGPFDIVAERLRHALPDQEQRVDDADRRQDVERAAGHIDPKFSISLPGRQD